MDEFNMQAQNIEEQTILKHQSEMEKFMQDIEASIPLRPKESSELLNLRRIQQNLAKSKEYTTFECHILIISKLYSSSRFSNVDTSVTGFICSVTIQLRRTLLDTVGI